MASLNLRTMRTVLEKVLFFMLYRVIGVLFTCGDKYNGELGKSALFSKFVTLHTHKVGSRLPLHTEII